MKTSRVLLGVLAGAAAGALMGILFAPDKGTNTRKKIARKGEDLVDDVKDRVDQVKGRINRAVDKLAEALHPEESDDIIGNTRQRHSRMHN